MLPLSCGLFTQPAPSVVQRTGIWLHSSAGHFAVSLLLGKGELTKFELTLNFYSKVKPLGVIWGKFSEFYSKKNTIMFDDIGRNFLMNPQNGLKVRYNLLCSRNLKYVAELY